MKVQGQTVAHSDARNQEQTLLGYVGKWYYPLAMLGRLPFAMTVVGVFTLIVSVTGSYSNAGITSATVGIGTAIFGPVLGAAADRFGQRVVLLSSMFVHAGALIGLTVLTYNHAHVGVLVACAFLIGASAPQLAAMSRARLMTIIATKIPENDQLRTTNRAMSIESVADELVFVFGPVAVGLLAPFVGPWAPIVAAAVVTVICVLGFALHHTAAVTVRGANGSQHDAQAPLRDVFRSPVIVLALGMFFVGCFFGSTFTGLTSFMDDRGLGDSTGLVYAAMGLGSAALALSVVLFPAKFTLAARFFWFSLVTLAGALMLPFVTEIWHMVVVLIVMGIGLGPVLVTLFSLGSQRSPVGRAATVMTLMSSAVVVGQSLSTAAMGRLVDGFGTTPVLYVPALAAVAFVVMSLWNTAIQKKI